MLVLKSKYKIAQAKLELLGHKDLINVSAFNTWFCDDTKSKDIYAHSGIFLRGDKLSEYHIKYYWKSLTNLDDSTINGIINEFHFIVYNFENNIRTDWYKKQEM